MVWLLMLGVGFFAWRALGYFIQRRQLAGALSLGACALFVAGIATDYLIFQGAAEPAVAAPVEQAVPVEAPTAAPTPVQDPSEIDSFYEQADEPADEAPAEASSDEEMVAE